MDTKTLEREALSLPASDRAKLAHDLLESLGELPIADVDNLWLEEAKRRVQELDTGRMEFIPAELAMRKASALLR